MGIDHEKKGFVRFLYLTEKLGGKFAVQFLAAPVGHLGTVPTVSERLLSGRHDVLGLAEYPGHETILNQSLGQGRYAGLDLGEAKRPAVVGIATGHPDRPRRHANRNRDVPVLEAQTLTGELIDVRGRALDLGAIDSDGVAVHVVQGNEHDVEFRLGKGADVEDCAGQKGKRQGFHATHQKGKKFPDQENL